MEGLVHVWKMHPPLPENVLFSFISDWESIYKIPFLHWYGKENGKASDAQSLNVRLSLCWADSVCWASRQQENKLCLQNYFPGHEILVSGYYPVYPLCCSVTFAMGSETLQHLSNDRRGNSYPRATKSSAQAGLWKRKSEPERWCEYRRVKGLSQIQSTAHTAWLQGETELSLQQWLISLSPGHCPWFWSTVRARAAPSLSFGWCRKNRADLLVSCWHLKQQYQESKGSGKHQLHRFLPWSQYKPGPLNLPPLMLWGRREEIAHIWVVPAQLFSPWSLK